VVVDASFEHRIDEAERRLLDEAELHGEIVSPPAGAIGRGDAFVLRIAERTGATVLSMTRSKSSTASTLGSSTTAG